MAETGKALQDNATPESRIIPHASSEAELPKLEDEAGPSESFVAGHSYVPIGAWAGRLVIKAGPSLGPFKA